LPHIAELMKDTDAIRKQAEEQVRNSRQNNEGVLDRYRKRIAKLEAKPEEERSRSEKRMLTQLKKSMEAYEGESKIDTRAVDQMVTQLTSRLKIINSIAVSDQDIFIVCGESQGYGYALWRTDHDFDNAKQVMNGMRGCCGQMDVQVQGSDLIVAENCSHAFARYDREGKKLGQWGKNERNSSDAEAFGGCCNPMNVRSGANGDIFTAESEGIIKRFSSNGDFVAMIGHRPLSGGCKNVAVASSPDGKEVYFCDQPGQQIVVLAEAQTDKGAESTGDAETGDTGAGEPLSPSDTFVSPPVEAEP
jgi:hypothetical protein